MDRDSTSSSHLTNKKLNASLARREVLLARIIDKLATSIDHDITLQEITQLLVPAFADYSRVAIVDENKQLKEINVNHKDPSKVQLASELFENYKGRPEATHGIEKILRSGKAEIIEVIDEKILNAIQNNKPLYESVKKIGLKSYMGVPLIARGKVIGAITLSSVRSDRYYTKNDLEFAQEIGHRIALALDNSRLYKQSQLEITERRKSEKKLLETQKKLLFLSEASKLLSSSLDYKTTVNNVAKLAIPHIADWYIVDALNFEGQVEMLAVAHKDPKMVKLAREFRKTHPIDLASNTGVARVIKSGKSEFIPAVTDEMLVAGIENKKILKLIRSLDLSSIIEVPLLVGGSAIGAITFIMTNSRHFTSTDLSIAEELGNRVALAIQNAQLYTEAKKAIEVRDEFISVASHELKTPVTSLNLYIQVLREKYRKSGELGSLKYFEKIDNQVRKLAVLIGDLLNVSKVEHGKMEFTMEKFHIEDMINEIISMLKHSSKNHQFELSGKIGQEVFGDRDRLSQVITNLLTNAVKYSPGGKKVKITLTKKKKAAEIAVRDFGIGIAPEHQKKIFSKFYRVSGSKEKTYPGLGMGLYIANEIIKRHGGEIKVVSVKGKGTEFSFTIPLQK